MKTNIPVSISFSEDALDKDFPKGKGEVSNFTVVYMS